MTLRRILRDTVFLLLFEQQEKNPLDGFQQAS